MKTTLNFKTTIACNGCLTTVTPFLNKVERVEEWKVDITNPDKVLTVQGEGVTEEQITAAVTAAGFKAERL